MERRSFLGALGAVLAAAFGWRRRYSEAQLRAEARRALVLSSDYTVPDTLVEQAGYEKRQLVAGEDLEWPGIVYIGTDGKVYQSRHPAAKLAALLPPDA